MADDSNPFTGTFDGQGYNITNLFINRTSTDYVGLFGYVDSGSVTNVSLLNNNVSGNDQIGGFVGYNMGSATVQDCYAIGYTNGTSNVGGFCGVTLLLSWDASLTTRPPE